MDFSPREIFKAGESVRFEKTIQADPAVPANKAVFKVKRTTGTHIPRRDLHASNFQDLNEKLDRLVRISEARKLIGPWTTKPKASRRAEISSLPETRPIQVTKFEFATKQDATLLKRDAAKTRLANLWPYGKSKPLTAEDVAKALVKEKADAARQQKFVSFFRPEDPKFLKREITGYPAEENLAKANLKKTPFLASFKPLGKEAPPPRTLWSPPHD